ncbi:MAG: sel1 repeat family protein [Proteobacteria bacterium]|nr:sel1 repeat family protein [Pseudomonadota bacterium]
MTISANEILNVGVKGLLSIIAGFVSKPAFDAAEEGAKKGKPLAQFKLGLMYYKGRGTARDYTKAVHWWRRAAEQGFTEALNNLGMSYGNGDGVEQDYVQAHKWFDLAASRHPPVGKRRNSVRDRDFLARKMTAAQIAEARRLTGEWTAAFGNREQ